MAYIVYSVRILPV